MTNTLIQMTVLMFCGAVWRVVSPNRLAADQTRLVLTSVVYYFLLPAMVLDVLWKADIGWHSLKFSALGMSVVLLSLLCAALLAKVLRLKKAQTGAMLLATGFPNVTYLGLPVLEQTFGPWTRSVVIQMDLFSIAPLVYTLGIMLAKHYGKDESRSSASPIAFLNAPPFWAAFIAVVLNLKGLTAPLWLDGLLLKLSAAVAPLMIFSLGLALSLRAIKFSNLPFIVPVCLLKLLLMPYLALQIADGLAFDSATRAAAVMDLAMPSMVLGVVLCDRYHLDSSLYAAAVTVTTGFSLLSLPFWYGVL